MSQPSNQTDNEKHPDLPNSGAPERKRNAILAWLRPPTFGDLNKDRIATIQNTITLALASITLGYTVFFLISNRPAGSLLIPGGATLAFVSALFALRRGHLNIGSGILVGTVILLSLQSFLINTFSALSVVELSLVFALAGILFRPRVMIGVSVLMMTTLALSVFFKPPSMTQNSIIALFLGLTVVALVMTLASYSFQQVFAQADRSNRHLTQANQALQDLTTNLEARVTERTKTLERQAVQLQAATEVSRAVSSVFDVEDLIQKAVDLARARFDLYYVGLFLLDEDRLFAVLHAGTGEAAQQMLAAGHKLEVNDDSMIGWCMAHKEARITLHAGENAARFDNPLLPNTRSELALPLISQGDVIGAMTVQSDREDAFNPEDINILQTMADQLANGIEKARLYGQIRQRAIELDIARDAANLARNEAEQARAGAEEANRSLAAQVWLTAGQATLNEKMRGEQDIATLSKNVIQHLCKYIEAYSGAIFALQDETLHLTASYAQRRKSFSQQYRLGEDIIGQAAVEKQIILHETPDEYIALGLNQGKVIPKFTLVIPITYIDQVSGVIAIESTSSFNHQQRRFLQDVSESIAIAFITAQARTRVNELFAQTRQQAEELQAQEEELRATNEELEAQTESLRASETQLKAKQATLDEQNQVLREAQQELERHAEELTITNKYKSEFLANMSHELRTPLNSLLILSGILAKNEGGNLTPNQVESAQIIYSSGSDLLQLINEILDLSKVEAGHMDFHFAPMSFDSLTQNMRTLFEHVAQERNLEFKTVVAQGLPDSIVTDQQRLEQVVKNLLSNAFKFTEAGAVQLLVEAADADMVAIRVSDSGIGMSPEQQKRVFEAFQQADGSTSRKYGGTGLGLTISREMISRLGGKIGLESEPGKGSTFTIYLPAHPQSPAEAAADQPQDEEPTFQPPASHAVTHPRTKLIPPDDRDKIRKEDKVLLVIEDDATFARVLLDYAHRKDFKVILAGDGESGLKLATIHIPDAILLDLKLPGMSGWDVLDTLKGDANLRHIPVHILSAANQTMDAYKRGALGFLSKPVDQTQLDTVFSTITEFLLRGIKSLLIVEDDTALRHSVGQLLGGSDVQISEAASGTAALALLREGRFDCMILDLTLPDMTGFELLNKINQDPTVSKCPVIVYTGQALTEEENTELLKYASSVIIKGVKSPERLLDETALFLHRVVADMPTEKQKTIHLLHDRDAVFSGKHILIVDDNMRNAFALSNLLTDRNLRSTIARSGMKAIELLDTTTDIDLVLMDIMMPEMDGYEAIQRIRAQHKFKSLPILALTAKAMKGDLEKCIAAGANDYLSKPIDPDRLFSMLRVWLYR